MSEEKEPKSYKNFVIIILICSAIVIFLAFLATKMNFNEEKTLSCLRANNWDHNSCDSLCRSSYCLTETEKLWKNQIDTTECLLWNDMFFIDTINSACDSVVQNNTCKWHEDGDVSITWTAYNRTDRYDCTGRIAKKT